MPARGVGLSQRHLLATRMIVAFAVLAIAAYAAISRYAEVIAAGGNDHQAGDWLISYPDGFVRRGLFGELLLGLTPPGAVTLWVLFAVQVAIYVPLFAFIIDYLFRSRFSWSAIALACSPAGLAFIGWDPLGAFRKEILGFLALVLLAVARRRLVGWLRGALLASSLAVWTFGLFSWESLAFLLPGVAFLLLTDDQLPLRRTLIAAYTGIAGIAFGASVVAHGSPGVTSQLCQAVTDHGLGTNLCTGAFVWMGRTPGASLNLVSQYADVHSGYLMMLALAMLPIAVSPWLRRYWGWALFALIGIAPLFVLGIDYGRWIHMLVVELTICMIAGNLALIESKLWNPLSAGLFISVWGIPHAAPTSANLAGWPFKGLLVTVITWIQSGLLSWR